jgi:hypothetical protein
MVPYFHSTLKNSEVFLVCHNGILLPSTSALLIPVPSVQQGQSRFL